MLGVGAKFPPYKLKATVSSDFDKAFRDVSHESFDDVETGQHKWMVYFFYPKDFTFVCPTEIAGFGKLNDQFQDLNAQVVSVSHDSEFVHHAWRNSHPDLKDLPFPMLADTKHELSGALGIIDPTDGASQRAVFIVDPTQKIRFVYVTDLSVGRSPEEVLRVLKALQTNELTPCNWNAGQPTLSK